MKRRTLVALAGVVVVLAALAYALSGHRAPEGQPPLAELTAGALPTLQEEFNRYSDEVRVILLLSPT